MDPSDHREPLSDTIRKHLGQALALAYADVPDLQNTDRFKDLLAHLELALVQQKDKDERDFRAALLELVPNLVGYAMSLSRDRTQADDLVQETLLKAWRFRVRFQPGTNLGAWLFTIMRNNFYTEGRKYGREVQDVDGANAERLAVVPAQDSALDLQDLQVALDKLQPAMREALVLVTINNVSYEEAAAIMGCQLGTVKSRVSRAREHLADLLGYAVGEIGTDRVMLAATGSGAVTRD